MRSTAASHSEHVAKLGTHYHNDYNQVELHLNCLFLHAHEQLHGHCKVILRIED